MGRTVCHAHAAPISNSKHDKGLYCCLFFIFTIDRWLAGWTGLAGCLLACSLWHCIAHMPILSYWEPFIVSYSHFTTLCSSQRMRHCFNVTYIEVEHISYLYACLCFSCCSYRGCRCWCCDAIIEIKKKMNVCRSLFHLFRSFSLTEKSALQIFNIAIIYNLAGSRLISVSLLSFWRSNIVCVASWRFCNTRDDCVIRAITTTIENVFGIQLAWKIIYFTWHMRSESVMRATEKLANCMYMAPQIFKCSRLKSSYPPTAMTSQNRFSST